MIRFRRLGVTVTLLVTMSALLIGATVSTVSAAGQPKVTVCQYNETLGTFSQAEVGPGGKPNKSQYFPDTALNGKTIYAVAYTNADGIPGYSAAGCDVFLSALVENSGDSTAGAGDLILFGRRPTKFQPAYGFASFAVTSVNVASGGTCDQIQVLAPFAPSGTGAASWFTHTSSEQATSNLGGASIFEIDWIGQPETNKDTLGTAVSSQILQHRWDPADNAFLDVDVSCPPA
jgi:hypothetical protein